MDGFRKIASNLVFGVISLGMILMGGMKLLGLPMIAESFAALNLPLEMARVIGLVEIFMVIGLWVKPYRVASSIVLAMIYAGATGAHLGAGQGIMAAVPAMVFAFLLLGGNVLEDAWKRIASPFGKSGAILELTRKDHHDTDTHKKAA